VIGAIFLRPPVWKIVAVNDSGVSRPLIVGAVSVKQCAGMFHNDSREQQ